MEVAIGGNGSTPFQREVREWQRVDPETGALLTGRLEADRWINGPLNAYGKVVDSQNVSQPNGTQHTQRKQLEVLQARTSSGSLQVVRAQTVQTSSSRWSSGTRTTQALDGQRLSSGLSLNGHHHKESHHFTNGHHSHLSSSKQNFHSQLSHFNSQNIGGPHLLATQPSLKLSTLMKSSSAALDGGGRISPHSMPLLQRHHSQLVQQQHQQLESETQSSPFDCSRFQPTIVESRVGGGGYVGNNCESRHSKTQQMDGERETSDTINGSPRLSRARSVSTDDLATDWDPDTVDDTEPSEWRRVSKIRRSFQLPKNASPPKPSSTRPVDLPENSVSVSKIRQELENGRRLNTAMRNNYVDLAALDNILNGNGSPEPEHKTDGKTVKKASFLTAESLKEIRGKLKKLSDESLYKEDFITQNDIDKSNEVENDNSSNFIVQQPVILQDSHVVHQQTPGYTPPSRTTFQLRLKQDPQHTTNSLESRTKYRDTTSAEWHLRRKSYGFEKMTPPAESMFRMESSTDSGIGRSSELNSWSPTENAPRGTVITFGERKTPPRTIVTLMNNGEESSTSLKPVVNRRYHDPISETVEVKRHSIAVDESKYVRDNLKRVFDAKTSVHINGLYLKENNSSQASVTDESGRRQKRVEFCKTEVHFAAESGRVNIVETDGKPPPTNNFRRRRRTSGGSVTSAYLEAINSGVPVIHFGDEQKTAFEQESVVEETKALKSNVTVSIPVTNGPGPDVLISKPVLEEDEEAQFSDEISLRGILKNKPVKPKPYHLGENIDSSESLWGVRLKPVTGEEFAVKRRSYDGEREDAVSLEIEETKDISAGAIKSVAERVRIVEERKAGSGYSTKINLNLTNSPYSWEKTDLPKANVMSIELHSPTASVRKSQPAIITEVPVAKPRTISPVKTKRSLESETTTTAASAYQTQLSRKSHSKTEQIKQKEPLKVVTGGTRKLRDHELSYFGVKVSGSSEEKPSLHERTKISRSNNPSRKASSTESANKWKLSSDKPDLLRHSPQPSSNGYIDMKKGETYDGPIYENLKKPSSYTRKKDLQRDEMILSEMTKTADQTMKAMTEEHAVKDQQRRTPQRSTKPLDTIDEKRSSQSRSMKSKVVHVSRTPAESFQRPCRSNRPSSASSNESLSRFPQNPTPTRSSRSRESKSNTTSEYVNVNSVKKRSTPIRECTKVHRSSSRETQKSHASSSEDVSATYKVEEVRRVKRVKPKEKESSFKSHTTKPDERHRSTRASVENEDKSRSAKRLSGDPSTKSSRRSSSKTENQRKGSSSRTKAPISSSDPHRTQSRSAGIVTTTSSSSKRSRDHARK